MMSKRKHRQEKIYRELTREERSKTYFTGFSFEELFESNELTKLEDVVNELMERARKRIIGVFKEEREWYRKKYRRTDNYAIGVADKQSALARHIHSKMRNPILSRSELSSVFHDLSPKDQEAIRLQAEEKLLLATLNQMVSPTGTDIWYDEATGVWQLAQSCVDEVKRERQQARAAMNAIDGWFDQRTYHGRNGKQARKRDRGNGNAYRSTGFSNQVH